MVETPAEYVKKFAMSQLQRNQPTDSDTPVDPQSIFDEKLRYKVLMLETMPTKMSVEEKNAAGTSSAVSQRNIIWVFCLSSYILQMS